MSKQAWEEAIAVVTADGAAIHTTTTETIIFPDVELPANYMQYDRCLRLHAFGKLSTTGTPTITFAIRWGGVAGTLLATTEPLTTANNSTNVCWSLWALIQTRSNGSSGSLLVMGEYQLNLTATTVLAGVFGVSGFDAPAPVTVDLATTPKNLSITADWSVSSASNTLMGLLCTLEAVN